MTIHATIPVPLDGLPEGTQQKGYEDFVVQDLEIKAHNVCYRRLRYLLPDGSNRTAPLPAAREVSRYFQADDTSGRHLGTIGAHVGDRRASPPPHRPAEFLHPSPHPPTTSAPRSTAAVRW